MGMAASQARLLTITARLADNELRSQTINNAKMRLATETAQASDDYITALNNARMMFRNVDLTGTSQTQLLTYNSMTAFSPYNTQYGLVNSAGLLLVSEDEADIFEKSGNNLEKFLENHGLKWDTTYFGEDKNVIDRLQSYYGSDDFKLVPKPEDYETNPTSAEAQAYDNDPGLAFLFETSSVQDDGSIKTEKMTADKLRELYESYLRNDFSIERASFNAAESQYAVQKRTLYTNAVQDIWERLGVNKISDVVKDINKNNISVSTGSDMISYLNGKGISYYTQGYPDSFLDWATNLNITVSSGSWNSSLDRGNTAADNFANGTGDINGNTYNIYSVGSLDFYVDNSGQIYGVKSTYESSTSTVKYTIGSNTYDLNSASDIVVLTNMKWPNIDFTEDNTGESGDAGFKRTYKGVTDSTTGNTDIKTIEYFESSDEAKDTLVSEIISDLVYNQTSIDLDTFVDKSDSAYVQEYVDSRNEFYKLIFEDYEYDPNKFDLADKKDFYNNFKKLYKDLFDPKGTNIDSMECLTDFTLFLEYVHEYQVAPGHEGKPAYTSAFQNIIDAFTVELMRDELGEPKYAWVDTTDNVSSSDSSAPNEGNADAKAQWYENLFNRMRKGYAVIEDGLASSADWIEHAFEAGIVTMEQVDKSYNWVSLDYKCCASITEDTDNSAAVAIAEAKYNRAMNDIKRKDNMYDMQLKNIDTEHNALQTEYDVIKGVIAKNIERTMKFDQSA